MPNLTKKEIKQQLWYAGSITDWLLDDMQQDISKAIVSSKSRIFCAVVTRRGGKTFCALTHAVEYCHNHPNSIVSFIAPQQNQARDIAKITMREILEDCPEDIRPSFKTQENCFIFNNGSMIKLCGNNKQKIENIRGLKSNLVICDEVGFWDDMEYSIRSVILPMMNGITDAKLIMISTPPRSAGHPFAKFVQDAKADKSFIEKTVYDCPRFNSSDIDTYASEQGGYDSVGFQREYLCKFITDLSMAVLPEATEDLLKLVTQETKRPPYFDAYVSMDLGMKDLTAILFAHFDFIKSRVVIEDELSFNDPRDLVISKLAQNIQRKEEELWGDPDDNEFFEPYMRVSDVDSFVLNDLYMEHNIHFKATDKRDKEASLNMVRTMLASERIIINPKCVNLIRHLKEATWKNHNKKDYDRSSDNGHYDFIDALLYLVRNVDQYNNPYPRDYNFEFPEMDKTGIANKLFMAKGLSKNTSNYREGLISIFNPKRRS